MSPIYALFFSIVACVFWAFIVVVPSRARWKRDLRRINALVDSSFWQRASEHVNTYYALTTFRDYKILAYLTGRDAMHTELTGKQPIEYVGDIARRDDRVLELGCGKGSNLVTLDAYNQNLFLFGEDNSMPHVIASRATLGGRAQIDARDFCTTTKEKFDVIFSIEALSHIGSRVRVKTLCERISKQLTADGVFIIVDGFKADHFSRFDSEIRQAIHVIERGFCCSELHSVDTWRREAAYAGLEMVEHHDLTHEATPYWTRGWRFARFIAQFSWVIRWYQSREPQSRTETLANLMSVCAVAPALRMGVAKYAMLVFTSSKIYH